MKFTKRTIVYRIVGPAGMYVGDFVVFYTGQKIIKDYLMRNRRGGEDQHYMFKPFEIHPDGDTILDLWEVSREDFERNFQISFVRSSNLS